MQGSRPQSQPLPVGDDGSYLLWNGDVFSDEQQTCSDTEWLGQALASSSTDQEVCTTLSMLSGPRAFVYYRQETRSVFFGKDFFGRHSLLKSVTKDGIILTSVGSQEGNFSEVPAAGVFKIDLVNIFSPRGKIDLTLFPWRREMPSDSSEQVAGCDYIVSDVKLPNVIKPLYLNDDLTKPELFGTLHPTLENLLLASQESSESVDQLMKCLEKAGIFSGGAEHIFLICYTWPHFILFMKPLYLF